MNTKIMKTLRKFLKGNKGEEEVLNSIIEILRKNGDDNYYLIPKNTLGDFNSSHEIDLLLLHPIFGLYAIEVKNWNTLQITQENNPFNQANTYKNLLMSLLEEEFSRIPINVEYRVVFPSISRDEANQFFSQNPYYKNYQHHVFFKEDLQDSDVFKRFFNSSNPVIPNKKDFTKLTKLLIPTDKIKDKKVIPIITKDEIIFFDQKQLSVLNGYTGGFRIIRGVAGTGKTIILTNFVSNKLKRDYDEKFLILCFNQKLANDLKNSFSKKQKENIEIYSVFEFLQVINFDFEKVGITNQTSLANKYKIFESDIALDEFAYKLRKYLDKNPIDYFLADETQDLPAGFVRIIYEEINDIILFIDEAQRIYSFTMKSIADVFHHQNKRFKKLNMTGRVKNLKNVYRTPSNIAKSAFEILSFDKAINDYYKKSFYLKDGFLSDIKFVLEDGKIEIKDFNDFDKLKEIIKELDDNEENIILTNSKASREAIENIVKFMNKNIKVDTIQSIKGLESQNVIIHNFDWFLISSSKHKETFYRQIYVLLTRAQSKLILSISSETKLKNDEKTAKILEILKAYQTKTKDIPINTDKKHKLAKIKPAISNVKEGMELIVTGAELFGVIAGLFSM